ncbi:MAG: phytanoyl-CoA dioxygenase family protein [Sphingomonas sp.]|uniref:phytanoyl-CoA dioxygenase family protein n=1 Tax=Sphingomonas sp. TaxID=28214 RepID=UPI001ACB1FFF|nr:phytanoyl-CoA dioxygenase family protein [Sphingomonas sp.]MBN8808409.1 phytanoyl-CoA dioxygenase family protein [Sphingomonas sp.]
MAGSSVDGVFRNTLGLSQRFAELVCDERLLGPAYDFYGEQTSLHGFDVLVRQPDRVRRSAWHFDGPRRLPYSSFSPSIPLVLKIGVWLTDVETAKAGAYQFLPGSHRRAPTEIYNLEQDEQGQTDLLVRAGDVTIHHSDLWHRPTSSGDGTPRYSLFITYAPSWIAPRETFAEVDLMGNDRLATLLRCYPDPTARIKPPAQEAPLHPDADLDLLRGDALGSAPLPYWIDHDS